MTSSPDLDEANLACYLHDGCRTVVSFLVDHAPLLSHSPMTGLWENAESGPDVIPTVQRTSISRSMAEG